jgi:GNAT superfamily N-acetyltransferase
VPATIRSATVDDVHSFLAVKVEAWRWAYAGILPADHLAALSIDEQAVAWRERFVAPDSAADGSVFVAVDGGRVVGLGRSLHDRALAALHAAGFERATLWVLEANTRGRGFYEHVGWAPDGARGDHMVECANHPMVRFAIEL